MNRGAKEIVGVLMQVLGGAEISHDQLTELSFEADGELQRALNEAYIKIMEFAYDSELRVRDPVLDRAIVQAILAAMQMIGAELYTSDHHKAGYLMWHEPGCGYGFPVTQNPRDLLIGDDAKYL